MLAEPLKPLAALLKSTSPPTRSRWAFLVPLVVWATWAALFAALLGFIAAFGHNVPFGDDWDLLPWVSGQRPIDLDWLWRPHNEHHIPLPKVIGLALGRLTGCDSRAGMYFGVVILGGISAALVLAARRLRGRTALSDAFFPLALLHWGQHQVLLWNIAGVHFVTDALFAFTALLALVSVRGEPTARQGLLVGVCLVGLPLCGVMGLVLVPPLALWLAAAAVARWRSGRPRARRDAALWLALAGAAAGLSVFSFVGPRGVGVHPPSPSASATVQTACQFLVMALGPSGESLLPFSALALLVLAVCCALGAAVAVRRRPAERWRGTALLCYLAALLGLALAVGWGRAGYGGVTARYGSRFVTLAVPLLCWCYFAALCAPLRTAPLRVVPWALFLAAVALLPFNALEGLHHGRSQANLLSAVEEAIRAGRSPEDIAQGWQPTVDPSSGARDPIPDRLRQMRECLEWLCRTSQGPYKGLHSSDPAVRDGAGGSMK